MSTASAWPSRMMASACCASVISPTAAVAMPASATDALGERHLVARPELDLLIRRKAARRDVHQIHALWPSAARANSTLWSRSQPPAGSQSVALMRTKSGSRSGQTPRTAFTTSSSRRIRFSKLPP